MQLQNKKKRPEKFKIIKVNHFYFMQAQVQ